MESGDGGALLLLADRDEDGLDVSVAVMEEVFAAAPGFNRRLCRSLEGMSGKL